MPGNQQNVNFSANQQNPLVYAFNPGE